jgi:hypothetical protein
MFEVEERALAVLYMLCVAKWLIRRYVSPVKSQVHSVYHHAE